MFYETSLELSFLMCLLYPQVKAMGLNPSAVLRRDMLGCPKVLTERYPSSCQGLTSSTGVELMGCGQLLEIPLISLGEPKVNSLATTATTFSCSSNRERISTCR